jgi:hypothetical protein
VARLLSSYRYDIFVNFEYLDEYPFPLPTIGGTLDNVLQKGTLKIGYVANDALPYINCSLGDKT